MNNEAITVTILVVATVLGWLLWSERSTWGWEAQVCETGTDRCTTHALYESESTCKPWLEKGNWMCDSRDPKNITCKVATTSPYYGRCVQRRSLLPSY